MVFASISLARNKKIQALVKFYVFLIQKFECTENLIKQIQTWPENLAKMSFRVHLPSRL